MQVRKQQLELDMEQQTGTKLGKEDVKAVYCHYPCLTSMQVHHEKCQGGWSTGRNINNLKYADETVLMAESEEELKILLKVKLA